MTDPGVFAGLDVAMDGSTDGFLGQVDLIKGRGRRLRSEEERVGIAAERVIPGAKASDVARRHDVTRWQVYDWRRKLSSEQLAVPASAMTDTSLIAEEALRQIAQLYAIEGVARGASPGPREDDLLG